MKLLGCLGLTDFPSKSSEQSQGSDWGRLLTDFAVIFYYQAETFFACAQIVEF